MRDRQGRLADRCEASVNRRPKSGPGSTPEDDRPIDDGLEASSVICIVAGTAAARFIRGRLGLGTSDHHGEHRPPRPMRRGRQKGESG